MRSLIAVTLAGVILFWPRPGQSTIHDISISGFDFVPAGLTINQGDTVRWTNQDSFTHTSTSDNGIWNSGNLLHNQSYSRAFVDPGTFPYHCAIHTSMKDTLTVTPVSNFDIQIDIGDNFFTPAVVQIATGQIVRWVNNGAMDHTTTSEDGLWDSGTLAPGQHFDFTFPSEGVHRYSCTLHPEMTATLIVGTPDSIAADIHIVDYAFEPPDVEVTVGRYVRWINFGAVDHTTTDTSHSAWDSGALHPGDVFTLSANTIGTFDYICSFHPGMAGTLMVSPIIDVTVHMEDDFFDPAVIHIDPGQTVRWMNMGAHIHTSTSNDGVWDSGNLTSDQHFDFTFANEGVYHYHCANHPLVMKGTVIVGKPDTVAFDINIVDFAFQPSDTTLSVGQNVRWINMGAVPHTTTDTSANYWDSGTLNSGDVFTLHAGQPGTFHYLCNFHPGMTGSLAIRDTTSGGPCEYIIGDINGNNVANGIDVVYAVGFFKGGSPPPDVCDCPGHGSIYAAGDVNGNCVFNGIDVTYFVGYLKGGPALRACPDCPPGPMPASDQGGGTKTSQN